MTALTGQLGTLIAYDWFHRVYFRASAVSLCRPDRIQPDVEADALEPEPWSDATPAPPQVYRKDELHLGMALLLANYDTLTITRAAELLGTSYASAGKALRTRPDVFERVPEGGLIKRWRLRKTPETALETAA